MNKQEVIMTLSEKTSLTKKEAERALNAFIELIGEEMAKGGEVSLTGFGKFEVKERAERNGRNPQTGETMVIPARKVVTFKAGKQLQEKVK